MSSNNEYLDNLMNELKEQGIEPPTQEISPRNHIEDKELQVIMDIEKVTGTKFSDEQRKILEHHGNACILACAGSGKALVYNEPVLTVYGWKNIGDIQIGDIVYDRHFDKQIVLGVFPQGKRKVYKVHFNDGTVIKCDKDHLWTVYVKHITLNKGIPGTFTEVLTTEKIMQLLRESDNMNGIHIVRTNTSNDNLNYLDFLESKTLKGILPTRYEVLKMIADDFGNKYADNFLNYIIENDDCTVEDILYKLVCEDNRYNNKDLVDTIILAMNIKGLRTKLDDHGAEEIGKYCITLTDEYYIKRIEETDDEEEMVCISVSGAEQLYITRNFTMTHNTTININLIAKRILTGEIADVNKLIYTTYSKEGSIEMKDRLDMLLEQLGMDVNVQVRTIHSFFLQVIRTFGVTNEVLKNSDRKKFIKQACNDAGVTLKDDDLLLIDGLLSYQVNNLLSDKKTIESYVNTLEDLTLEQYSEIRKSYAIQKNQKKLIDFDDMQSLLYMWLVKFDRSEKEEERQIAKSVRDYCKAVWTDFYIDEAQDVSKIQFAIIRAMVTKPDDTNTLEKGFMFIGDDDQCLLEGTKVKTPDGFKNIEDINVGDNVITCVGHGKVQYAPVENVSKKKIEENIYVIETKNGYAVEGTYNHIGFARLDSTKDYYYVCIKYTKNVGYTICIIQAEKMDSQCKKEPYGIEDIWIIRVCSSYSSARYWQTYYSFKYGVVDSLAEQGFELESIIDLHKKINTIANGNIMMDKMNIHGRYPHASIKLASEDYLQFTADNKYRCMNFSNMKIGMKIPVYDEENDIIVEDEIIDITTERYVGYVYDLSLPVTKNFIANGIVVHNCIYQWRGGDPSIILSAGPTFNIPTFVLSTNYRCKSEIVDYATNGIKCNNSRYNKSMTAFDNGGDVKILPSVKEDLCNLSILAMNHIKYWISQGYNLSDIAVLSRNNFHLAILSNMLLREGIYCNMSEEMKLTKSSMYTDIKNLMALTEKSWNYGLTSQVLWKLCRYLGVSGAKVIANFQENSGSFLVDTLGWIINKFIDNSIGQGCVVNSNIQAEEKIKYHIGKLSTETREDMKVVYQALKCANRAESIRTLLFQYLEASSFMYKSKDKKRSINGLVIYIDNLIRKDGVDKMLEFLRVTEQLENGRMIIPGEKMTLSTIHSAKGREWKNVIMFACDNVSQPSFDGIYGMIEDGISIHDIYENIDEERRLFYVGNTRAKENLLVITYRQPSIFILEALGEFKDRSGGNNGSVLELVNDIEAISKYNKVINDNILNKNSKYYYDSNKYRITP